MDEVENCWHDTLVAGAHNNDSRSQWAERWTMTQRRLSLTQIHELYTSRSAHSLLPDSFLATSVIAVCNDSPILATRLTKMQLVV